MTGFFGIGRKKHRSSPLGRRPAGSLSDITTKHPADTMRAKELIEQYRNQHPSRRCLSYDRDNVQSTHGPLGKGRAAELTASIKLLTASIKQLLVVFSDAVAFARF
jgi:hypothetical protein